MAKPKLRPPAAEPAPWDALLLVCGKCLRKAGREAFRGELKRAAKDAGVRGLRIAESGCLDLCPKRGITLARGRDLDGTAPRLHVVDEDVAIAVVVDWLRGD